MSAKRSWKTVIDKRRKINFVGRTDYLQQFSENFASEEPAFLLFFVTGEGGVGKSTLLKQYEASSSNSSVDTICITCDDEQISPVAAMGYIAVQLAKHDIKSKEFDERFKTYRIRKEEIESDPAAPRGALNLVVRGMTGFAIKAARQTPGVGVFAEYVDEQAAGEALSQGINYLVSRIANKDEVELLREPERILTPLFIELLNDVCEKHRLVLMFDVFERTHELLDPWLLEFLKFEYGEFDTHLTFVVSGRDAPDQHWTEIASSICHISLEPFTLEETRLYLSHRGVIDEQLIKQIHEDTGGLPVLVELLAGTNPNPDMPLPDISKDAVKRFLQWIPEDERRRVALLAAVPRQFNQDILKATLGGEGGNQFNWLSIQSYIRTSKTRGWFYHEKVRELMLRYLQNATPNDLTATHAQLAESFRTLQNQMGLDSKDAYESESWKKYEVERVYHLLCAQPENNLVEAINAFLIAFHWRWGVGNSIAQACWLAGRETSSNEVRECSITLSEFYQSYDTKEYEKLIVQANKLVHRSGLDPLAQASLFVLRGEACCQTGRQEQGLADFNHAIELYNKNASIFILRGSVYLQMGKYEQALADFNCGIELNDKDASIFVFRGCACLQMGKYEQALADFNYGIELNNKDASAFVFRGLTYGQLKKYEQALADLDCAIKLDDKMAFIFTSRGAIYSEMNKYEQALADFDSAIELDDKMGFIFAVRGTIYFEMHKYEQALADFDRAIELDDKLTFIFARRSLLYSQMGRHEEALADFDRVFGLDDKNASTFLGRGVIYSRMDKYEQALAEFARAIELDDKNASTFIVRGAIYSQIDKYEEALTDFAHAIELDDKNASTFLARSMLYSEMDKYEEALTDFAHAIELDDKNASTFLARGMLYSEMDKYEEALTDFARAIELDDKNASTFIKRGVVYSQTDKYEEALTDFARAIELDNKNARTFIERGVVYSQTDKYEEALTDFDRAIELDDKDARTFFERGEVYFQTDKYEEALTDFDRAIELDDKDARTFFERGEVYFQTDKYEEALTDFDRAIELNNEDASLFSRRGQTYVCIGKYDQAIADFDCAVELDDEDASIIVERGATYRLIGDLEKALSDLNRSVVLDDESDYALALRGDVYRRLQNYDASIKDLSLAIKIDPEEDSFPRSRRAAVYHALGDVKSRDADIKYVVELSANEVSRFYNKAVVYVLSDEYSKAIEFLRKAIKKDTLARFYAQSDDLFQPLRNLAEFQELIDAK